MLTYITVISAVLLIILILLQQRGASLGAGSGASGELHTERRGIEKSMFEASVFMAIVFVMSIIVSIVFPNLN